MNYYDYLWVFKFKLLLLFWGEVNFLVYYVILGLKLFNKFLFCSNLDIDGENSEVF